MKLTNILLLLTALFFLGSCMGYEEKKLVGNPSAFSGSSNGADLLPALDTSCGGSPCIN